MTRKVWVVLGALVMTVGVASAQPSRWRLIGERTVDAARDKATIDLDGRGGRFDQVRLVDADMDAEIVGVVITLGNGQVFVPDVHERQLGLGESVTFALPEGARSIRSIRLDTAVVGEPFGAGPWGRIRVFARPDADRAYGKGDPIASGDANAASGTIELPVDAAHADAHLTVASTDLDLDLGQVEVEHTDGTRETIAAAALGDVTRPVRAVRVAYIDHGDHHGKVTLYAQR